jgi:hypothetical protein
MMKGGSMKRFLSLVVVVMIVGIFIGACSGESVMDAFIGEPEEETSSEPVESTEQNEEAQQTEMTVGSPGEGLVGTWINEDYNSDNRSAMVEYTQKADGTILYSSYDMSDGTGNVYTGTVDIKEMKTDAQGRVVAESVVTLEGGMSWETLFRISKDGATLEVQSGTQSIDPKGPRYSIYYRQ